jgi:hypothetical protein
MPDPLKNLDGRAPKKKLGCHACSENPCVRRARLVGLNQCTVMFDESLMDRGPGPRDLKGGKQQCKRIWQTSEPVSAPRRFNPAARAAFFKRLVSGRIGRFFTPRTRSEYDARIWAHARSRFKGAPSGESRWASSEGFQSSQLRKLFRWNAIRGPCPLGFRLMGAAPRGPSGCWSDSLFMVVVLVGVHSVVCFGVVVAVAATLAAKVCFEFRGKVKFRLVGYRSGIIWVPGSRCPIFRMILTSRLTRVLSQFKVSLISVGVSPGFSGESRTSRVLGLGVC